MRFRIPASACAVLLMLAFLCAIRINALRNRVAMNAEGGGGVRDAFLVSRVSFLNVKLLELIESFIQKDVTVEHVFDYGFEAGADLHLIFSNSYPPATAGGTDSGGSAFN